MRMKKYNYYFMGGPYDNTSKEFNKMGTEIFRLPFRKEKPEISFENCWKHLFPTSMAFDIVATAIYELVYTSEINNENNTTYFIYKHIP